MANSFRKTYFRTNIVTTRATRTIGVKCTMKSLNENPAADPMIILGGSPTSVATPPTSERIASAMRSGIGEMASLSATRIVTGAMRTIVVTLSRNIETNVVTVPKATVSFQGSPRVAFAAATARYSKAPVFPSIATRTIIPNNRPIVLKSIAFKAAPWE
jgi:hypothetical protein